MKSFRGSAGWCSRFTDRYRMKSRVLHESVGSAEVEHAEPLMQNLHQHLSDYPLSRNFNVDETALFFKLLPRHTCTLENENIKRIRGTKSMKAKNRVTA